MRLSGSNIGTTLRGGSADDLIYGGSVQCGRGGDDIIRASYGRDRAYGGDGDDWLYGGSNNDTLFGGRGDDRLYGGSGNDELRGDEGLDTLYGGAGNDALVDPDGGGALFGGDGDDQLHGSQGDDTLTGDAGADVFYIACFIAADPETWTGHYLPSGDDTITDFGAGDVLDLLMEPIEGVFEPRPPLEPRPDADQIWQAGDTGVTVTGAGLTLDLAVLYGVGPGTITLLGVERLVWGEDVLV